MAQTNEPSSVDNRQNSAKEYTVSSKSTLPVLDRLPAIAWLRPKLPDLKLKFTKTTITILVGIIISGLVGFAAGWLGAGVHTNNSNEVINGTLSPQKEVVTSQGELISSIAKSVGPSVVSVNVTSTSSQNSSGLFELGLPQTEKAPVQVLF